MIPRFSNISTARTLWSTGQEGLFSDLLIITINIITVNLKLSHLRPIYGYILFLNIILYIILLVGIANQKIKKIQSNKRIAIRL